MAEKKPSYWEQLRDPRWQQKRLKVMERDGWKCRDCGDKGTTFNVHHTYYERGNAPWDYPDASLISLCEPCHQKRTEARLELDKMIGVLDWNGFLAMRSFVIGLVTITRGTDSLPGDLISEPWHYQDWLTDVMTCGLLVGPAEFGSEVLAIRKAVSAGDLSSDTACVGHFAQAVADRFWGEEVK